MFKLHLQSVVNGCESGLHDIFSRKYECLCLTLEGNPFGGFVDFGHASRMAVLLNLKK